VANKAIQEQEEKLLRSSPRSDPTTESTPVKTTNQLNSEDGKMYRGAPKQFAGRSLGRNNKRIADKQHKCEETEIKIKKTNEELFKKSDHYERAEKLLRLDNKKCSKIYRSFNRDEEKYLVRKNSRNHRIKIKTDCKRDGKKSAVNNQAIKELEEKLVGLSPGINLTNEGAPSTKRTKKKMR
jgi:hypothetical protein